MKKISENRLRQIINEELGLEIQKLEDNEVAKENINKILSILKHVEDSAEQEGQNLNEFIAPLAKGALGVAGIAGLLGVSPDDIGNYADGVISGEQDINITGAMKDWLARQLIAKGLATVKIDGELNEVITAALMSVNPDELKAFFFDPDCDTFIGFIWEALMNYLAGKIAGPLGNFFGSVGGSVPIIKNAFKDKGAFGAASMGAGISAEAIKMQFLTNPDVVAWMDENIKTRVCEMFDEINFDMKSMTGGILSGLMSMSRSALTE
jgi:hypothetical protein